MTIICIGMYRCPYWPECSDPDRCLLDEECEEILKEDKEIMKEVKE